MRDHFNDVSNEADVIVNGISNLLPNEMDGKTAIEAMKNEGSRNWRQMEWIGFWLEHFVDTKVAPEMGVRSGPVYGNTRFDIQRSFVWDLKAHPNGNQVLILNDQEAVQSCIADHEGLGFIIVSGEATYDTTGDFKQWHDLMKGGKSGYELERERRKARSRLRKTSFRPTDVEAVWLANKDAIIKGVQEGWLGAFQQGMRNSDGSPRRVKFRLNTSKIPSEIILAHRTLS